MQGDKQSRLERNREQAKRTYPVIYWILQCRHEGEQLIANEALYGHVEMWPTEEIVRAAALFTQAVDQGKPLLIEVCRVLDVPPWVIRHLQRSGVRAVSWYYQDRMALSRHLAKLTPELAPRTKAEYQAMFSVFGRLANSVVAERLEQPFSKADQRAINRCLLSRGGFSGHEYSSFLSDIASLLGYEEAVWKERIFQDLGEPSISDWFVLVGRHEQVKRRALSRLAAHGRQPNYSLPNRGQEWPPLIPEWVHLDGLDFYALCSVEELVGEGAAFRHCVVEYVSKCIQGKSYILTARSQGARVATVEIVPRQRDGRLFWRLNQAKGLKNELIPPTIKATIQKFVDHLNIGVIPATSSILGDLQGRLSDLPLDHSEGQVVPEPDDDLSSLLLRITNECGPDAIEIFRPLMEVRPGQGQLFSDLQQFLEGRGRGCTRVPFSADGDLRAMVRSFTV